MKRTGSFLTPLCVAMCIGCQTHHLEPYQLPKTFAAYLLQFPVLDSGPAQFVLVALPEKFRRTTSELKEEYCFEAPDGDKLCITLGTNATDRILKMTEQSYNRTDPKDVIRLTDNAIGYRRIWKAQGKILKGYQNLGTWSRNRTEVLFDWRSSVDVSEDVANILKSIRYDQTLQSESNTYKYVGSQITVLRLTPPQQ